MSAARLESRDFFLALSIEITIVVARKEMTDMTTKSSIRVNPCFLKRCLFIFLGRISIKNVLSAGIEPALQDPQSCVLSIERRKQIKIPNF